MIDSTQASVAQAACGAKPEVCSAQVAPLAASALKTRLSTMPMMTISSRATPSAFISTARSGWLNNCERALKAASIMRSQLMPAAAMSKASAVVPGDRATRGRPGTHNPCE